MHPPRHSAFWTGAALTLLEFVACACNAQESAADALHSDGNVQTVNHCESCLARALDFTAPALDASDAAPASTNRVAAAPETQTAHPETPPPTPNPFATLRFRDQEPLVNRLRRLQAVPFLTLWDSGEATVYVGVDHKGKAGLHVRQKTKDRGSRATQTLAAPEDERAPPRPPKSRGR